MYVWVSMLLLGGALLVSCSDDEGGDDNKKITLSEETSKKQDFFADETSNNKGIEFTTLGPWQAKVEDVTGTKAAVEADWVVLSQYSGDAAGTYSLTVTLQPNYTGKDRKAVIRIICGDTEITISISQKGKAESGFKPKMVKEVRYEEFYGEHESSTPDMYRQVFAYDERGRVVRIDSYEKDDNGKEVQYETMELDYNVVGEITIKVKDTDEDAYGSDVYMLKATIDKHGRATKLVGLAGDKGQCLFGYNEAGQLAKVETQEEYSSSADYIERYFYTDGLVNKVSFWSRYDGGNEETQEYTLDELYPHRYSAMTSNLDLNGMLGFLGDFGSDEDIDEYVGVLYSMRLLGMGNKCLLEPSMFGDEDSVVSGSAEMGYPTPGEVIHKSYVTTEYHEGDDMNTFELDAEKCVTKVSAEFPYDVIEVEYDIVVSHELVHPDRPELGYQYTTDNYKETKITTEKNRYVYNVTYQD